MLQQETSSACKTCTALSSHNLTRPPSQSMILDNQKYFSFKHQNRIYFHHISWHSQSQLYEVEAVSEFFLVFGDQNNVLASYHQLPELPRALDVLSVERLDENFRNFDAHGLEQCGAVLGLAEQRDFAFTEVELSSLVDLDAVDQRDVEVLVERLDVAAYGAANAVLLADIDFHSRPTASELLEQRQRPGGFFHSRVNVAGELSFLASVNGC